MEHKFYALKLIPSRSDFSQTMNDEEKSIMQQHVVFWKEMMTKGNVVAFGPILDPKGVYGFGIIKATSEDIVKEFIYADPASKIMSYEFYQMLAVLPHDS